MSRGQSGMSIYIEKLHNRGKWTWEHVVAIWQMEWTGAAYGGTESQQPKI